MKWLYKYRVFTTANAVNPNISSFLAQIIQRI